jgi:predicted MFS family arabinose efflux permease
VPSGLLADRFGGPRVLLGGLALWSVATAALPLARGSPAPLAVLTLARVLFGLGSAVALPAVSATVSRLVPAALRASQLATIYAAFNLGSIVGMATTPPLVAASGWPACFVLYGTLGLAWAFVATALLPSYVRRGSRASGGRRRGSGGAKLPPPPPPSSPGFVLRKGGAVQLAALIWVHSVIGFGFFVMLSWIPTYLVTTHAFTDLRAVGVVAALPWLVCAVVGVAAGGLADWLGTARGWGAFRVRTAMNRVATLGPATALALLPFARGPISAVMLLSLAMGAQSFNYAGFHAHVQDVAGGQAGTLQALSNTGGIVMGIAGNILTGALVSRTGSFTAIFALSAALYLSSVAVWTTVLRAGSLFADEAPEEEAEE